MDIHVTPKPQILFARIDEKEMLEKIEAEQPKKAAGKTSGAGETADHDR